MPRKRASKLRCPICKKPVKNSEPDYPFCSDRCRSVDLGKWASGAYVIPVTEADDPDAMLDEVARPNEDSDSD
ncbi:MAG: DNA gyrase inhibitor YacG [Terriglobales bacterium]